MHRHLSGQDSFLVPTIRHTSIRKTVDLGYHISGGNRGLETVLKFLMGVRKYEPEKWNSEICEYYWIIHERIMEMVDLGMSSRLSRNDKLKLSIFNKYSQQKDLGVNLPENQILASRFDISANSYFGLKNSFKFPVVSERRRPERNHPTSYIGVGYKDKGNAGDDAVDASPSWQQVAMDAFEQSNKVRDLIPFLREKRGPLRTIELNSYNEFSGRREKVDLVQLEDRRGFTQGWKVFTGNPGTNYPMEFLREVPERFWPTVFANIGIHCTDGVYFVLPKSAQIRSKSKSSNEWTARP